MDDQFRTHTSSEIRDCGSLYLGSPDAPDGLTLAALLLKTVEAQFISTYQARVNQFAKVKISGSYELLRYTPGGFYVEHVDAIHDHPVLGHRRLSFVLFCNDDYEGGELHFSRQGITVRPEAGSALLFPSGITHPHAVRPVLSGTRYSIVNWYF